MFTPKQSQAQGYSLVNFIACTSNAAPTSTCISNSRFGTIGTGVNSSIHNTSGALTVVDQSSSPCGADARITGKLLQYNSTLGSGVNTQFVEIDFPTSPTISTEQWYSVWVCHNYPQNEPAFGGTFDPEVLTPIGGSQISNFSCSGTQCVVGLEGCASYSGNHSCPTIVHATSQWRVKVYHYANGGLCTDTVFLTDCVVMYLYDPSTTPYTLVGMQYEGTTGTTTPPSYMTYGNVNPNGGTSGHVVQWGQITHGNLGASIGSVFPLAPKAMPWSGLITYPRGVDWSNSGIVGNNSGTLPSSSYTQCGSTLAAGSYAGSTITSSLAGCGASTFYLLGAGTFNISGQIALPTSGKVVLRGSGAASTFLVHTGSGAAGCAQSSTFICLSPPDTSFTTQPPPNTCTWTAGFSQGTTSVTLSNLAGTCLTAISTSNPTLLFFDACDTGYSGAACGTGTAVDNTNLFICGDIYTTGPTLGCSADGPDGGGSRPERDQLEIHIATAVNTGTGVVTLATPLLMPNWAALSNKQVWIQQPVTLEGVENLSVDTSNGTAPNQAIELFGCYHCWVSGVRVVNGKRALINLFQTSNTIVQSSYLYTCTGTAPSCYGIRQSASANNLIANNIIQGVLSPVFDDGASTGHVFIGNFIVNDQDPSNSMSPAMTEHAGNYMDLFEHNCVNQISSDDIHGTGSLITKFRNCLWGWESKPSTPVTGFTQGISDYAFARYENDLGNVIGTPGYHGAYSTCGSTSIYFAGCGIGAASPAIPADTLGKTTSVFWDTYDIVTNAIRLCGNSLNTNFASAGNCNNVSEAGASASTFPAFVPVVGDTAVGQAALPASFFYTARPTWWDVSIPFPAVGPDVSSGNVGQCSGALNTVGQFNGTAALSNAQCGSHGFTSSSWAGHINAIPAMVCALNTMGMPPDGSGAALTFDASTCFTGNAPTPPTINSTIGAGTTLKPGASIR